ncbi:MAG: hypothetical protein HN884_01875 [Rhodospirillaceae bacterium]|jgi:hypothetical protein|nr:hypothetical protein [Rhodospirillaceae bacterium]MBT7265595.1 hypothetical protein [Rhodospirillaceae bacterium]
MGLVPDWLVDGINTAFPKNVCLVGIALPDGYAQISPRGSVVVYDENTLAIWNRGGGTTAESGSDGSKMTVYFRNSEFGARGGNGLLPAGGIARFYGTAEVHKEDGDVREKVWTTMHPKERENDPDKAGHAVLIHLERAEQLNHKPLGDLPGPE